MTHVTTYQKASTLAALLAASFAFSTVSASAMDCSGSYAHMKTKANDVVAEAPALTPLPDNNALAMSTPSDDAFLLLQKTPVAE